jgi:hypothetical protein
MNLINTPFVSKIEPLLANIRELRFTLDPYDYGNVAPSDVDVALERLKVPLNYNEGTLYDGEVKQGTNICEGRGIIVK